MGPPGCGKGTISERIVRDFAMIHVASGDILRNHILKETVLGMEAEPYVDGGQLVPDNIMLDLIIGELAKLNNKSWLLDGFPRTLKQAEAVQTIETKEVVIDLNVPFEVIIERIKGRWVHIPSGRIYHTEFSPPKVPGKDDMTGEPLVQRHDDKPETVEKRLEAYRKMTEPVLNFYKQEGILTEFTGKYSNEIWPLVHKFLSTKMTPLQYTVYK
ncbi:GTP:AMP phosphotransferase AK3, mitochondrial [Lamellibrachia satsuma]|nr:GTP:AMP phosphotransferase AK3, mitochondrial [Lamellibrachia satsuma]